LFSTCFLSGVGIVSFNDIAVLLSSSIKR
jgi:hypothetical protein